VTLKNLVDLAEQIETDEKLLNAELRRRDRPIGQELSTLANDPLAQLCGWLDRIRDTHSTATGSRISSALRVGILLLVVSALLFGWLTAATVFYYNGSHPVNIINALAVFVGLQLLLLLITLLAFLPGKFLKFLPGMRALRETFSLFSPGRLLRLIPRLLPAQAKETASVLVGKSSAHRSIYGRVEKWLLVRAGQAFAVAFNLGALAGCLYLVLFSDLAFGWSTTLQVDAASLKLLIDGLSSPWAWLIPQAQPSLELIETSRYFRFQSGTLPGIGTDGPAVLGNWWPFLILCLLIYGLLPRLLTLSLASAQLRKAYRTTMLHLPGVQTILDRLNSQLVETRAEQPESAPHVSLNGVVAGRYIGSLRGQTISVIDWGGTGQQAEQIGAWLQSSLEATLERFLEAGGACSLEHDQQVLQTLAASTEGPIILLVKSWEPPMAEFTDFIHDLRQSIIKKRPIAVVPLGLGSANSPLPPTTEMAAVWSTKVKQLGDPWAFLVPPEQAGRS
jgi:hypothetical protein